MEIDNTKTGVIEILQIATECGVVILTAVGFLNVCELDDSEVKGWCEAIIDACRHNLVYGETCR